jgi:hypothetical protein
MSTYWVAIRNQINSVYKFKLLELVRIVRSNIIKMELEIDDLYTEHDVTLYNSTQLITYTYIPYYISYEFMIHIIIINCNTMSSRQMYVKSFNIVIQLNFFTLYNFPHLL